MWGGVLAPPRRHFGGGRPGLPGHSGESGTAPPAMFILAASSGTHVKRRFRLIGRSLIRVLTRRREVAFGENARRGRARTSPRHPV